MVSLKRQLEQATSSALDLESRTQAFRSPTMTRPKLLENHAGPDDSSLAMLAGMQSLGSLLKFLSLQGPRRANIQHTDAHTYPSVQEDKSYTPGLTPEQGLDVAMHRPLSSTWLRSEPIQSPWSTWRSRSLRRATTPSSRTSLSLTPWHGWPRAHPKYLETEASAFP